jgi:hypothetical protein
MQEVRAQCRRAADVVRDDRGPVEPPELQHRGEASSVAGQRDVLSAPLVGRAEAEQVEHLHAEALRQARSDAPPRPRRPRRAVHHHYWRPVPEPIPGDAAGVSRKALTEDPLAHQRDATRSHRRGGGHAQRLLPLARVAADPSMRGWDCPALWSQCDAYPGRFARRPGAFPFGCQRASWSPNLKRRPHGTRENSTASASAHACFPEPCSSRPLGRQRCRGSSVAIARPRPLGSVARASRRERCPRSRPGLVIVLRQSLTSIVRVALRSLVPRELRCISEGGASLRAWGWPVASPMIASYVLAGTAPAALTSSIGVTVTSCWPSMRSGTPSPTSPRI